MNWIGNKSRKPTIKIQDGDDFALINAEDFDPATMTEYSAGSPPVEKRVVRRGRPKKKADE